MYKILSPDRRSVMKDFFQAGGWNVSLVKHLHDIYMLTGAKTGSSEKTISEQSGTDTDIVQAFMVALQDAAIKGEIDYKLYDPETYTKAAEVKKDILTPSPLKNLENFGKIAILLTGGIIAVNLLSYLPKKMR